MTGVTITPVIQPSISVMILTRNEQQNLPGCLESAAWSNDVHVFDSASTDATQQIARDHGAYVTERLFDNWAAHQNWGLANIPFRHPWVFYLDADERVTPELLESMSAAVGNPGDNVAFRLRRRDYLEDTWLRHVQATPFYIRLFRPEKMRYERLVNPVSIPDGPVGELAGYLDHFPFSKGIGDWLDRHNRYAAFEAEQIVANEQAREPFSLTGAFLEKDFHRRRYHQKELLYRLPARPVAKFLLLYLAKGGFLDGGAGFRYSILQSIYEYMIVIKTKELRRGSG